MKTNPHDAAMDDLDIRREHRFSGASRIILLSTLLFAVLGIWAYFGKLDEVSTGSGKVIPGSREHGFAVAGWRHSRRAHGTRRR